MTRFTFINERNKFIKDLKEILPVMGYLIKLVDSFWLIRKMKTPGLYTRIWLRNWDFEILRNRISAWFGQVGHGAAAGAARAVKGLNLKQMILTVVEPLRFCWGAKSCWRLNFPLFVPPDLLADILKCCFLKSKVFAFSAHFGIYLKFLVIFV